MASTTPNTTPAGTIAKRLAARQSSGARLLKGIRVGLRRYSSSKPALVALFIVVAVVLVAIFAELITTQSPTSTHLTARFVPPLTEGYILGSDTLGRDVLTRVIFGARVSLAVSVLAALISVVVGVLLGLLAGFKGGWTDIILMRIVDGQVGFPFIVIAVVVVAIIGGSVLTLVLLLGLWGWAFFGRLTRGEILTIKENEYITAARAIGASSTRIAFRHVLPQAIAPIIVLASFYLPAIMVIEASLSFLGLGISPPTPTWGNMLAESRAHMERAWWVLLMPGLALSLTVLAFNIVGDRLRDVLDPRLRGVTY